jgi:lysozyme
MTPKISKIDSVQTQVLKDLRRQEGLRLAAYWDDIGKVWTIGYGSTGPDVTKGTVWTLARAEEDLLKDFRSARLEAISLMPNWSSHNAARQGVLINMAYNLGWERLSKFKNTLRMIENQDYAAASVGMLNSLWAKQVKGRARELAERMRTGVVKETHA